jgi:hypothetical protein
MLQAWLAAFVWATMFPVGALTLLVVHRLTGGDWGYALAPVLEPAARAILPVAVISIPILIFSGSIYRWMSPDFPANVSRVYMSSGPYAARTIFALLFWSAFAWFPSLRATAVGAAVCLLGLAIITNMVPVDWVVSAQPGFYSTAYGFGFGIEQVLAALALCALIGVQGAEPQRCADLAAMIIAGLLGVTYFVFVQFLIIWYGDLPKRVFWYVVRSSGPWPAIAAIAFIVGDGAPFLFLLNQKVRRSRSALRIVGAGIVLGIVLHIVWEVAPSFSVVAMPPAILAIAIIGGLFAAWLWWLGPAFQRSRCETGARVPGHA